MSDGGTRAMIESIRKRMYSTNGIVAMVGIVTLIVGIFLGSPVGRIICGITFAGVVGFFYLQWKSGNSFMRSRGEEDKEDLYSQPPEGQMKKLLFDDFQSSGSGYVVKEIEEEGTVVPSTRAAQPAPMPPREEKPKEFSISDFFDLDSDVFRSDAEPRSEFNFLLTKVLHALKEVLFAHSVAFFWSNSEKQQLVLEMNITDSQNFMTDKRLPISGDVISQVATTGKPQILGRVNPVSEKEVVHYYESPEYIKSLVCVPVYYLNGAKDGAPVGVIVADSKAEDAFGPETFGLLGNFTKLVSALIKSYTEKYDLLLDSELLTSIRRMQDRVKSNSSEEAVLASVAEEAGRLVNWDALTLTMYSDDHKGWSIHKVVNRNGVPYINQHLQVDFNESVVGQVIRSNKLQTIDNLSVVRPMRFCLGEPMEAAGSFLCVPISSMNRCYGALTLESKAVANFSGVEVETIYRLVENAASLLEVLYMNDMVKDYVPVDQLTGALTKKHFMRKLEEEIARADDFGTELTYVSLAIDDVQEQVKRYGAEGFDSILASVVRVVRANTRSYDIIGRLDGDELGVVLYSTAGSDGYLWAEKLRKQIASHIITLENRSISVTVSAGVNGLGEGMNKEQLIAGTNQVLHKAMEDGGNLVRVY